MFLPRLSLVVLLAAGCGASSPVEPLSLTILGTHVSGWSSGPASGTGVLLLHGARFRASTWTDLGTPDALDPNLYVLAVDLPGYGASQPQAGEPDPASWLLALLDALDLERVVLVAPSMSGCYALPFAVAHPERLSGIVPIAPACAETFAGPVQVPALVLWGEEDTVFPLLPVPPQTPHSDRPNRAEALAASFPGARVELFAGASHPCYLDDPARFHGLLAAFVDEVE